MNAENLESLNRRGVVVVFVDGDIPIRNFKFGFSSSAFKLGRCI